MEAPMKKDQRIAELEAERDRFLVELEKARWLLDKLRKQLVEAQAESKRLKFDKAQWYQTAQHYRETLQEIRDATPANKPEEWPHCHWYLVKASNAINHCDDETSAGAAGKTGASTKY